MTLDVELGGPLPVTLFVDPDKYRGWTLVQVVTDLRQTLGLVLTTVEGDAVMQAAIEIVTAANTQRGEVWIATPATGIPTHIPWERV